MTASLRRYLNPQALGQVGVVILITGLITAAHYAAPPDWHHFHIVMGHAYLLPIVVASYWFQVPGGVAVSIIVGVLYAPHIPVQFRGFEFTMFFDLALYAIIGAVTGILSGRLRKTTERVVEAEESLRSAERLTTVGELAAGVAHEIRNPLGAIKGAVEILGDGCRPSDPNHEFLEIIDKEIARLDRLVEEFLRFTRQAPPRRNRVRLAEVLRTVAFLSSFKARKVGVELSIRVDEDLELPADEDLLKQALLNVVFNGIEACAEAGGKGSVSIEASSGDGFIHVRIADTGAGIPDEEAGRVFEPFFTTKARGTGLGLAVTRRIVEGHGGRLELKSRPGRGTEVLLRIPAGVREASDD